ncbi:hypothetical protein ACP26C_12355 [Franconibacter helveticus 513]|uniref:hypothetical protein n=1 Tax=Franconibacter helveticus TaxID=357240 RepID=UPI000408559D|nr:hypothetical protein [Franconibacter helveticus]
MVQTSKQDRMPYLIYLCEGRILAQNIDGHVIDIGGFSEEEGAFSWLLDGNNEKGEGLRSANEALEDIAANVTFYFLDGQFTSLPDLSEQYQDKLPSAPSREILLNELSDPAPGASAD